MTQRLVLYRGPIFIYGEEYTHVRLPGDDYGRMVAVLARVLDPEDPWTNEDSYCRIRSISVPFVVNDLCIAWETCARKCLFQFVGADPEQVEGMAWTAKFITHTLRQKKLYADFDQIITQSRLFSTWEVK